MCLVVNESRVPAVWAAVTAGVAGGLFFAWLVGVRVLTPTEATWVMRGDWQWHFLGWHLFRNEPWQLPPGIITSYLEPIGSALGYTDSIPLVALTLKPFASWLPNPFNYLGLWFLLNYTLLGFFGALVVGTWTPRPLLQFLGACLLVLLPTLLARMAHPALASHWLLVWALWLNWRAPRPVNGAELAQHAAIGAVSGLVHPYLAVMVLVLLLPLMVRRFIAGPGSRLSGLAPFSMAAVAVIAGWWASGLFTVRSTADLQSRGLGDYSMNLLGPVTPAGRSLFLPDLPVVSIEQIGEGFQYLGLGVLVVCVMALIISIVRRTRLALTTVPLLVVLAGCTLHALSPRVTFGSRILIDLVDEVGSVSMFRATGRFFWPVAYALAAAAAGTVAAGLKPKVAGLVLAGAIVLQAVDLQKFFLTLHDGARDPGFYAWNTPLGSAEWDALLPKYRHIRLYSPEVCRGAIPVAFAPVAYLAGIHGLAVNDGFAARIDRARQDDECARLGKEFRSGVIDDGTVYLVAPVFLPEFEQRAAGAAACRAIDGVAVCVSTRSLTKEGS